MAGILPDNLADLGPYEPPRKRRPKRKSRRAPGVTGGILPDSGDAWSGRSLGWAPGSHFAPGWDVEIAAPPVRRGRPRKLSPQQRIDVGSYIINRQWDIAVARAKERDGGSAEARRF